jgi:hypothetical protein
MLFSSKYITLHYGVHFGKPSRAAWTWTIGPKKEVGLVSASALEPNLPRELQRSPKRHETTRDSFLTASRRIWQENSIFVVNLANKR